MVAHDDGGHQMAIDTHHPNGAILKSSQHDPILGHQRPPSHFLAYVDRFTTFLDQHQRSLAAIRGKSDTYRPPVQAWVTTQLLSLLQQYPGGVTQPVAETHLCVRWVEQVDHPDR